LSYINDNIKAARKKTGLTQDQIAEKLGVKRTTYASWEDKTEPALSTVNEIAKVVGVGIMDLLTENSEAIDKIQKLEEAPVRYSNSESDQYIIALEKGLNTALEQISQLQKNLDKMLRRQQVIAAMNDASLEALLFDLADRKQLDRVEVRRSVRSRAFSKLGQFEIKGIEVDTYT
jgi:DNA-binding XRE family transcriptional regulator